MRRYVCTIYWLIGVLFFVEPFLSAFTANKYIIHGLEIVILMQLFVCCWHVFSHKADVHYGKVAQVLWCALAAVSIGIIVRGDYGGGLLKFLLKFKYGYGLMVYLLPAVILPLPNLKYFDAILSVLFKLQLLVIPLWMIGFSPDGLVREVFYGERIGVYLPVISAFLLGFLRLLSPSRRIVTFCIYLIYLLLMVLNARRNMVLSLGLYGLVAIIVNVLFSDNKKATLIMLVALLFSAVTIGANFERLSTGILSNLMDRGMEDTRSGVEMIFLYDFSNSPATDIAFGRGIDGTYYQEMVDKDTGEVTYDREGIETGYLHMVLKGGVVYVVLLIAMMMTAIVTGCRMRRRYLAYLSLVMVIFLVDSYTSNPICTFSIRTVIFWLSLSLLLQQVPKQAN